MDDKSNESLINQIMMPASSATPPPSSSSSLSTTSSLPSSPLSGTRLIYNGNQLDEIEEESEARVMSSRMYQEDIRQTKRNNEDDMKIFAEIDEYPLNKSNKSDFVMFKQYESGDSNQLYDSAINLHDQKQQSQQAQQNQQQNLGYLLSILNSLLQTFLITDIRYINPNDARTYSSMQPLPSSFERNVMQYQSNSSGNSINFSAMSRSNLSVATTGISAEQLPYIFRSTNGCIVRQGNYDIVFLAVGTSISTSSVSNHGASASTNTSANFKTTFRSTSLTQSRTGELKIYHYLSPLISSKGKSNRICTVLMESMKQVQSFELSGEILQLGIMFGTELQRNDSDIIRTALLNVICSCDDGTFRAFAVRYDGVSLSQAQTNPQNGLFPVVTDALSKINQSTRVLAIECFKNIAIAVGDEMGDVNVFYSRKGRKYYKKISFDGPISSLSFIPSSEDADEKESDEILCIDLAVGGAAGYACVVFNVFSDGEPKKLLLPDSDRYDSVVSITHAKSGPNHVGILLGTWSGCVVCYSLPRNNQGNVKYCWEYALPDPIRSVSVGDYSHDGLNDVLVVTSAGFCILQRNLNKTLERLQKSV